jgi:Family of unknown function (DUF5977)
MDLLHMKRNFIVGLIEFMFIIPAVSFAQNTIPNDAFELSKNTNDVIEQAQNPSVGNTGEMNIAIPLTTIDCGNGLKIPISMTYHGSGIKVSQTPSIVGLGWDLNVGGLVTRAVHGMPDEIIDLIDDPDASTGYPTLYNSAAPFDISYWGNCTKLDRTDWSSNTFLSSLRTAAGYAFSNSITQGYPYQANVDLAPDEFYFSVGNFSGSFFRNHKGVWVVKSDRPAKVQVTNLGLSIPTAPTRYINPSGIATIIITDEFGNNFTFGRITNNNAIEFSRSARPSIYLGYFDDRLYTNEITPTAWYISKIVTADGNEVDYTYGGVFVLQGRNDAWTWNTSVVVNGVQTSTYLNNPNNPVLTLLNEPIISQITSTRGLSIQFTTPQATQVSVASGPNYSSCSIPEFSSNSMCWSYIDYSGGAPVTYELSEMDISFQSSVKKKILFNYNNDPNDRLLLNSVSFSSPDLTVSNTFNFGYNPTKLPHYLSGKEDLLGYNNGNFYFGAYASTTVFTAVQLTSGYLPTRLPNQSLALAETLTSITFPTGGSVQYDYELNSYLNYLPYPQHVITTLATTQPAGGLRIRTVTANSGLSDPPLITKYSYTKNYIANPTSGISSGTLYDDITGRLLIVNQALFTCHHIISSSRKPFETPITYSEIAKILPDNSVVVSKFSSYDNGCVDFPPLAGSTHVDQNYGTIFGADYAYDNRNLTRGKLKSEELYNASSALVKRITYTYKHDVAGAQLDYVRSVQYLRTDCTPSAPGCYFDYVAYPQYYYNDYLASKQTQNYVSGVSNPITTTETYSYDALRSQQLIETDVNNSDGSTSKLTQKYPFDYAGTGSATPVTDAMVTSNIIGFPLDEFESITRAGVTTELKHKKTTYNFFNTNGIIKQQYEQTSTNGAAIVPGYNSTTDIAYNAYDAIGNLLDDNHWNNMHESFIWKYSATQPVAKIENASNTYSSFYVLAPQTTSGNITGMNSVNIPFTTYSVGTITIAVPNGSWLGGTNVTMTASYNLTGPQGQSGTLCNSAVNGCSSYPSTVSFTNMPAGTYNLLMSPMTNTASSPVPLNCTYPGHQLSSAGIQECYYEGFEEYSGAATATPFAGNYYYAGHFQVPFTMPNSRSYIVEYHYLSGSQWLPMSRAYTNNMTLSDGTAIDEVRVHPIDAQMTTYNYDPLYGITANVDVNNEPTYYQYDGLGRVNLIKDKDGNILKKICYNNSGQPVVCYGTYFYNNLEQQTFTPVCQPGYSAPAYNYIVAAGKYSSLLSKNDANQQALNEIATLGQTTANNSGTCVLAALANLTFGNSSSAYAYAQLTNIATNVVYNFTLPNNTANGTVAGQIPVGNYNAHIYSSGGGLYTFRIYTYTQAGVNSINATNLPLCLTCASIGVSNYP